MKYHPSKQSGQTYTNPGKLGLFVQRTIEVVVCIALGLAMVVASVYLHKITK